tara:strand:- start:717 stop:881 length:165 start_codon:yes stop_codon:yes gene_type:complete
VRILLKEINTKYYEETDEEGKRVIRIEKVETKHFTKEDSNINKNPIKSIITEYV